MSNQEQKPEQNQVINSDADMNSVGERVPSKHGRRFVTGYGEYIDDISLSGERHAWFVRSKKAHARIHEVDTSKAESMDGVDLVWTASDIAPHTEPYGVIMPDESPLANNKVRFVGDEVAVIVAKDRSTAKRAAEKVEVDYGPLQPVLEVEEALNPDSPAIHPELDADPSSNVQGNIAYNYEIEAGDTDTALEEADIVVEDTFKTNKTNPTPLEPKGCIADYNPGDEKLTIYTSNQIPHLFREYLSDGLTNINANDIIVKVPDIGGGFGIKQEVHSHEICASILSMELNRPIKFIFDRSDELQAGRGRHPERLDARLGVQEDGNIVAWDVQVTQSTGAHTSYGPAVISSAGITSAGPYYIENQHVTGKAVYTNKMPGSAVRGFGDPQYTFAREQLIQQAAERLGVDPIDIRLKNVPTKEEMPLRTPTGIKWRGDDMPKCIDLVKDAVNWSKHRGGSVTKDGKLRGVGMGTIMKRGGNKSIAGSESDSAIVNIDRFGEITFYIGTPSIGQGTETGMAQIVAETMGVNINRVTPIVGDTDIAPEGLGAYGDRGAMISGSAVGYAAADLKENLRPVAASLLNIGTSEVIFSNDEIKEKNNPNNAASIEELAKKAMFSDTSNQSEAHDYGARMTGQARFCSQEAEVPDPFGSLSHAYTFGAFAIVVDVDKRTGKISIADVAISEDVGKIINPELVEGQTQGGIVQGLGEVLLEEYKYSEEGDLITDTLVDYHLPTTKDVPIINKIDEVETPDPTTSHGQKGVGECPIVPVAAATANAVFDATGIRFTELPLSPEAVLPALIEHGLREI